MTMAFRRNAIQLSGLRSSFVIRASSFCVRHHPAPQTFGSPDACAQALQLHDLAVVDKEIHVCTVVFDIPCEYIGIGRFKRSRDTATVVSGSGRRGDRYPITRETEIGSLDWKSQSCSLQRTIFLL